MKKFWMLLMCMCLLMGIGCGSEEDTQWIDESAAMIGSEITEGQFVLDGVVYEFPMTLQYWIHGTTVMNLNCLMKRVTGSEYLPTIILTRQQS